MLVVEAGLKLDKDLKYYDSILKNHGLTNDFQVLTHDIYYTNIDLDGLSEYEIKNACIRLRSCNHEVYKVQNDLIKDINIKEVSDTELNNFENKLLDLDIKKCLIL